MRITRKRLHQIINEEMFQSDDMLTDVGDEAQHDELRQS